MQIKKQQLEPDKKEQTGSKLAKEYFNDVYCHPAYLASMQSTSCEMLGWKKHKLKARLPGEISITSDMPMTHLLAPPQGHLPHQWATVRMRKRCPPWVVLAMRALSLESSLDLAALHHLTNLHNHRKWPPSSRIPHRCS